MNQNKEIKINISENKWLTVEPLSSGVGIKAQMFSRAGGSIIPTLLGCVTNGHNGTSLYTFLDMARQRRTKIKGKPCDISLLHLNQSEGFSVKFSGDDYLIVNTLKNDGDDTGVEIFICDDKNVASLIRYTVDGDEISTEIIGTEMPIPKNEMLFGNDM
jgi:hypothetical protein